MTKEQPQTEAIDIQSLACWHATLPEISLEEPTERSRFPCNEDINKKVYITQHHPTLLKAEALAHPITDSSRSTSDLSQAILQKAGPHFIADLRRQDTCRTGEARLLKGYELLCPHFMNTVGPRYHERFRYAAENALFCCYRSVLHLARENNIRTLAITPISSMLKGFPDDIGAHIALRTIYRFLQHYGHSMDAIVLCFGSTPLHDLYAKLLPIYFPRNFLEEKEGIAMLPADVGNEYGQYQSDSESEEEEEDAVEPTETAKVIENTKAKAINASGLTKMVDNPDRTKRETVNYGADESRDRADIEKLYHRVLLQSKTVDLKDIEALNIIYRSGVDRRGDPIITIVGKNLPPGVSLHRVLTYVIKVMDSIRQKKFVLVYFHTNMKYECIPEYTWLKLVHQIFEVKFAPYLLGCYVIHPTFWMKFVGAIFRPFMSEALATRVFYYSNLKDILQFFTAEQLRITPDIYKFDSMKNGTSWDATASTAASAHEIL
ncbi:hypothetical protein PROFUN_05740 [Planoprotostelium fungivorum]|uniref:CRAL-TRIO domain-containing protein n=1 Tax=Planoprotostelium fungivorum TaxID=1890364 RepID=A0A2P6NQK7_9EUKA|nr:hypothetical protein PROFUN_05740 [Planoprotostelium fungivorum]